MKKLCIVYCLSALLIFGLAACKPSASSESRSSEKEIATKDYTVVEGVAANKLKLIEAARWQIGKTVSYNPAYEKLEYPMGDIPIERGVCTDVVVRAFRKGLNMDLQQLVHRDMKANFSIYPKIWGLKKPDKDIDHRRVPNLRIFFKRKGWQKRVTEEAKDYHPGDIVVSHVQGRRPHIMIVSDRLAKDGTPLVLHNIGWGTIEKNTLFDHPIRAHFRMPDSE